MQDFTFISPTKMFFGKNVENEIGQIITSYGYKRVLLHYGKSSAEKSGLLNVVRESLKENGIYFYEISGVEPNPDISLVREAIDELRNNPVDLILAIGGGSVIDSSKAIANGYYYDGDAFDFNLKKATPKKALPIGVILTISAAGSEMSSSCVISDRKNHLKRGFNSETNRPMFAIMNPELTYSVSKYQTACGIVDIMMHTMERYFNKSEYNELADNIAEGLLKSVIDAGWKAFNNPNDYDARATLMLASSLSHNGLTSLGKKSTMPVHQLEHALSGLYDNVTHGAGLSVLFLAWAKFYMYVDTQKFSKFAHNIFGVQLENPLESARLGIERLQRYFASLNMPITLEELQISNVDIESLVDIVSEHKTRIIEHHLLPMDYNVAKKIFELAKGEK